MNDSIQKTIYQALLKLFRPLVGILLKHGIAYAEAAELLKRAYVDVADRDFLLDGRKQSVARISVLTGLHRKEVKRLIELQPDDLNLEPLNRAARVVAGWLSDARFQGADGKPAALALLDDHVGFNALVKQYSGDIPSRAILDELLRSGVVQLTKEDTVVLKRKAYVPAKSDQQMIQILGVCSRDLLNTIAYNLQAEKGEDRLQLSVAYDNLSPQSVKQFKRLSQKDCLALIDKYNQWLAKEDRDNEGQSINQKTNNTEDSVRLRAGIGVYYFEEEIEEGHTE